MSHFTTYLVLQFGYLGIAVLMFLEGLAFPLPAELTMPFAGFLASRGLLNPWGAVLAGAVGSTLSGYLFYRLGCPINPQTALQWVERHSRWLSLNHADIEKVRRWFERYGGWTLLLGRQLPVLRNAISLQAGILGYQPDYYLAYTFPASLFWPAVLTYAGYTLGRRYTNIDQSLGTAALWIIAGTTGLLLLWVLWRKNHQPKEA